MNKYQHVTSKSKMKDVFLPNCTEIRKNSSVFHRLSKLNSVEKLTIYCFLHELFLLGH